jgi:hypothetical protein
LFIVINSKALDVLLMAAVPNTSHKSLPPFALPLATNESQRTLLGAEESFLNTIAASQVVEILFPLRELLHQDSDLAYHLWILFFPRLWGKFRPEEQERLTR